MKLYKEKIKMINESYANAYKEVLVIINKLVKKDYEKIPKEYIEFLEENCNSDYQFEYDSSKSFAEQELLDDTKYILFGLFEKFGATDMQKAKIKTFKNNYMNNLEKQKREKYNPNEIFKSKKNKSNTQKTIKQEEKLEMMEYKEEKWYKKILKRILDLFTRKK